MSKRQVYVCKILGELFKDMAGNIIQVCTLPHHLQYFKVNPAVLAKYRGIVSGSLAQYFR